jgi:hypothetical protein
MRQPNIENKYNLTPFSVTKLKINRAKVNGTYFFRCNKTGTWSLSGSTAKTSADFIYGTYSSFLLDIYDEDLLDFPGKIHLSFKSSGDKYHYDFDTFYDYMRIKTEQDLEIQENFLEKINFLIDEGVFVLP